MSMVTPTAQALAEQWRAVVGFEAFYAVSDLGRVMRTGGGCGARVGVVLRLGCQTHGYSTVSLCVGGIPKTHSVHVLVAAAFFGPCPGGREINHRNGDRSDNRLANLEYVTRLENARHAVDVLGKRQDGEFNPAAKLTRSQVEEVRRTSGTAPRWWLAAKAREWGVGVRALRDIKAGRKWRQ